MKGILLNIFSTLVGAMKYDNEIQILNQWHNSRCDKKFKNLGTTSGIITNI